jgi:hypothetical protein
LRGPLNVSGFDGVYPLLAKLARIRGLLARLREACIWKAAQPHFPFNPPGLADGGSPNFPGGEPEQPRSPNLPARTKGGL